MRHIRQSAKAYSRKQLKTLFDKEPAVRLIGKIAKQQWRLILVNIFSSLLEACSEGATLGVIFLSVQVLGSNSTHAPNWQGNALLHWAYYTIFLPNKLNSTTIFLCLVGVAIILQALQSLGNFLGLVSIGYFSAHCRARVTTHIHMSILDFSFPCASGYQVGNLIDHATTGPEAIQIQIEQYSQLLVSSMLISSYLFVLINISPWLLLAVAVMTGFLGIAQRLLLPQIANASLTVSKIQVTINSYMTENFQALRLLHSSGQLGSANRRLSQWMESLEAEMRTLSLKLSIIGPLTNLLPILAIVSISALSLVILGANNNIVLPSLVTFVIAIQRLNQRLTLVASNVDILAANQGRLARLNHILSPANKEFRRSGGKICNVVNSEIRFDNVTLQYNTDSQPALKCISFKIPKGHIVAIVGPSGAGKSSIADLLTGLYDPTAGQIWVDNTPLSQIDLTNWQKSIGVVSQDTFLFNASIAENIAFGNPDATQESITKASSAAQASDFINSLPEGYNTIIGERGFRLSGGQRQRLSLARAILRNPSLLILDEATSALDSQNERLVQEAIEQFERERTVLVIAHRLSTVMNADLIIVVDKGEIVEQGQHTSLLAGKGLYMSLWEKQA